MLICIVVYMRCVCVFLDVLSCTVCVMSASTVVTALVCVFGLIGVAIRRIFFWCGGCSGLSGRVTYLTPYLLTHVQQVALH